MSARKWLTRSAAVDLGPSNVNVNAVAPGFVRTDLLKRVPKEALTFYQRVVRRDPSYRDVQERIRRLQKVEPKAPVRAMAVGAENDDEIDRAFDEIIGSDKKK